MSRPIASGGSSAAMERASAMMKSLSTPAPEPVAVETEQRPSFEVRNGVTMLPRRPIGRRP